MSEQELKPCPKCHGFCKVSSGNTYHFVICLECMLSNEIYCNSTKQDKPGAVEDWNTRATSKDVEKLVTIVETYRKELLNALQVLDIRQAVEDTTLTEVNFRKDQLRLNLTMAEEALAAYRKGRK